MFSAVMLNDLPYIFLALIVALTFHEWGHAFVAHRLGDDTPVQRGRLTLNPLAHLDFVGTIFIFLVGFGWAKPVPIDERNLRYKSGPMWVALAGPTMNFLLALISCLLLVQNFRFGTRFDFNRLLAISLHLNLALMFLNLIPLGPLDGSHILEHLLPHEKRRAYTDWNLRFGGFVILGLFLGDMLTRGLIFGFLIRIPTAVTQAFLVKLMT